MSFAAAPVTPSHDIHDVEVQRATLQRCAGHIIAVLLLHDPMLPADLQAKIAQWGPHATVYDSALRHLERRLVVDITPSGHFKLGPNQDHFQLFRAMCTLNTIAWRPVPDSMEHFELLTRSFPFSLKELLEARDRMLETGLLVKDRGGCLAPGKDVLFSTRRPCAV